MTCCYLCACFYLFNVALVHVDVQLNLIVLLQRVTKNADYSKLNLARLWVTANDHPALMLHLQVRKIMTLVKLGGDQKAKRNCSRVVAAKI